MEGSAYLPYRSAAARDACFEYINSRAARDWPVRFEERSVPTSYGPTFVRISGPAGAPPLVLMPGAASPSLLWAPNIGALSAGHRTFAVDQIGDFGKSILTRPLRKYDDVLGWLDELLEGLGLRDGVNLAGISFGGALAASYALHFPRRLRTAVLLAPGATVLGLRAEFIARLIVAAIAQRKGLPSLFRWMFADGARASPEWMEATLEQLFLHMRHVVRRIPNPKVWTDAEWGSLSVPALFLVGEHETIYSAGKAVQRLKRVAPKVTAEIVPGAGHDLLFVQAAEVNRRILEFLRQEAAAANVVDEGLRAGA